MANCNNLFAEYNKKIKLSDDKRAVLINVRESLRQRMKANYALIPSTDRTNLQLDFQSQGSFVMDTIIRPLNDDFDLDDGVYFLGGLPEHARPAPQVFHNWVIKAIDKNTDYEDIKDKSTCVRVQYKLGFHIDLPVYYAEKYETPELAETKKGWIVSNPVEFIAWFEEKAQSGFQKSFLYESVRNAIPYEKWLNDMRKADCQLRRLVRYMKAWADLKRNEMPPGIIMTILVGGNFSQNQRDDLAFRDTLINIREYLEKNNCQCPRPTTPVGEDLFAETSPYDKQYFLSALDSLIVSADKAITANSIQDANTEWRKHFGSRFPLSASDVSSSPSTPVSPNLDSLKSTVVNKPWSQRHIF